MLDLINNLLDLGIFEHNQYFDNYIDLITSNIETKYVKYKTQFHHIIPRCYYVTNNIEIDDSNNNLVSLYFKDHVLAHYYLSLCMIDKYKYYNIYAFIGMSGRSNLDIEEKELIKNLSEYQSLYEKGIDRIREAHLGKEPWNKGLFGYNCGHEVSDETKQKISISAKGRYLNDIAIHKGDIDKHIPNELLEYYLNLGFELGRSDRYKQCLKDGYNYSVKGMLGKKQSDYQKEQASKANSHPRSQESRDKQKQVLKENILNGKYTYLRNPITHRCIKVNKENVQKYIEKGYIYK